MSYVPDPTRPTKHSFTPQIYCLSLFKYVTVFLERLIGLRVGFYLVFSFFVGLPPFRGILGFACRKIFKTSNTAPPPPPHQTDWSARNRKCYRNKYVLWMPSIISEGYIHTVKRKCFFTSNNFFKSPYQYSIRLFQNIR